MKQGCHLFLYENKYINLYVFLYIRIKTVVYIILRVALKCSLLKFSTKIAFVGGIPKQALDIEGKLVGCRQLLYFYILLETPLKLIMIFKVVQSLISPAMNYETFEKVYKSFFFKYSSKLHVLYVQDFDLFKHHL